MARRKDDAALIKMTRDENEYPAPHTADVHPDEVENMTSGGWRVVDAAAEAEKAQQAAEAELIEKINAAQTAEELGELVPKEPYGNAIAEAINDRMAELENVQEGTDAGN